MADQRIKIPRATDKSLITCFKELSELTGVQQISVIEVVTTINKKLKAFDPKRVASSLSEGQAQLEAI